jgi:hypothetical protein
LTVGSTERDETREVRGGTTIQTAKRQHCNFEVDAIRNGQPMKITQMISHRITTTSTGYDTSSSSILDLFERFRLGGRQASQKGVSKVDLRQNKGRG